MRRTVLLMAGASWLWLGCGDGGTGPAPSGDGQRFAAQFERLADSVDAGGYSPGGEALRHAAEIVRLTGHATPVNLTLDGSTRNFLAVAEQIDFPDLVCSWPSDTGVVQPPDTIPVPPPDTLPVPPPDTLPVPPDTLPVPPDTVPPPVDSSGVIPPSGGGGTPGDSVYPTEPPQPPECTVAGTYSMRTLIAWEPEHMAEVVRIVADVGSNGVATGVPDVMTDLPTEGASGQPGASTPPDSAPGGGGGSGGGGVGGYPGFMGEYLVRDEESWFAVEGTQANALEEISGACTDNKATFDWAEFRCEAARLRFEFSMRVEPLDYGRLTGRPAPPSGPGGSHTLAMSSSQVDGVRLTWVAWTPPPAPPPPPPGPGPIPVDSIVAGR